MTVRDRYKRRDKKGAPKTTNNFQLRRMKKTLMSRTENRWNMA